MPNFDTPTDAYSLAGLVILVFCWFFYIKFIRKKNSDIEEAEDMTQQQVEIMSLVVESMNKNTEAISKLTVFLENSNERQKMLRDIDSAILKEIVLRLENLEKLIQKRFVELNTFCQQHENISKEILDRLKERPCQK